MRHVVMAVVAVALGVAGCGGKARSFTPSEAVAENAVRRTLEAWKAGLPTGPLPDSKPVIHVTDEGRKPGQVLEDYTILGETRGTAGRSFAVTLNLAHPREEVKTKYLVVGIDPLWVFRQEDYELLMHWDHHMPDSNDVGSKQPAEQTPGASPE
jgi:hypothetical protein